MDDNEVVEGVAAMLESYADDIGADLGDSWDSSDLAEQIVSRVKSAYEI